MTADGKIYIRSYLITPIENGFSEDDKLKGYYIRFVFLDKGKENFRDVKVFLSEEERKISGKIKFKVEGELPTISSVFFQ